MKLKYLGAIWILLSAVFYSFTPVFGKYAYQGGINLVTMLGGRFTISAILLWLLVLLTGKKAAAKGYLVPLAVLSLLAYGGGSAFYFASLQLIPGSLASMILFTHPVFVALVEAAIFKLALTWSKGAALFLSAAGLVLIMGNVGLNISVRGMLLALASSFCYTAYMLYANRVSRRVDPVVATAYLLTFASLGYMTFGLLSGQLDFNYPLVTWAYVAGLAVFPSGLAVLCLFAGMRYIEASRAAIISTLEPVLSVILCAVLFAEVMGGLQILGGLLVLAAILVLQAGPGGQVQTPGLGRDE